MVLVSAEGSERRPPMEPPENTVLSPKQATWTKANDHMVFLDSSRIKSKYQLIYLDIYRVYLKLNNVSYKNISNETISFCLYEM